MDDPTLRIGDNMEFHFATPWDMRDKTTVSALDMEVVDPVDVKPEVGDTITLTLRVVAVHRTER